MGHLVKIHRRGINDLLKTGIYSIRANLRDRWEKTTADVLADAFCIRPGDYLFPWITYDKITGDKNEGFKYVFKVMHFLISGLFNYVPNDIRNFSFFLN